ncbi:MAG TPA: dehydrogenase, partial [Planctomycetaceae bacterium]|nr:dehydrogenase [Planctomycetaceae bacterium]
MNSGSLIRLLSRSLFSMLLLAVVCSGPLTAAEAKKELKAGIIGLDTSHAIAFTKMLNTGNPEGDLAGIRVVAAYP